jgi:hypothetical protein
VNCGDKKILVINGFYGRFDETTCGSCVYCQTGCFTDTTSKFKSVFNNKSSFSYNITNERIGSDPCQMTVKYAVLSFYCF